jgi:hypothetical protein
MAQGNMATGTGAGTAGRMSAGGSTGTPDVTYDLVSVMYHALQGAETYDQYIQDAEQTGDAEVAQFFREIKQEDERRATRGRELLSRCLSQGKQGGQRMSQ